MIEGEVCKLLEENSELEISGTVPLLLAPCTGQNALTNQDINYKQILFIKTVKVVD